MLSEINNLFILIWCNTFARLSFLLIIFLSLLLSIFFSIFASIVVITSYLSGCVVSFCLVKYRIEVGFCLQRLANLYHGHVTPKKKHSKSCNICDNFNCNRHQKTEIKEPWKGLMISSQLNQAVEDFYNKLLDNFIGTWYSSFTEDVTFINELRTSFRFATSTVIKRYTDVDVGKFISHKLGPCALRHIHDCLKIQEKAEREHSTIENAAVQYFGRRLHAAVTNRENELKYLRQLTSLLLPKLLPKKNLQCTNFNLLLREVISGWVFLPMMDVIADPSIINLLVNLVANQKTRISKQLCKRSIQVELLHNFTNYTDVKKAALGHDLTKIFKSPEILYSFMQFLKEEGPVNILQFCLDVEEFNRKLLTPELSKNDLENLYSESRQLYDMYLEARSPDFIGCPLEISSKLEHLLQGGAQHVPKLRTSTPLYKAYDYAFSILQTNWLPLFYHSDQFYRQVCGPKISSSYQKSTGLRLVVQSQGSPVRSRRVKGCEVGSGTVSKISSGLSRFKGALRAQPVDGALDHVEGPPPLEATLYIEQPLCRDLSTWRVDITRVDQTAGNKPAWVYHISVKRIDSCSDTDRYWTVQRYDPDFHTLKIKLVEFHGENEICDSPLPSRRSTTPIETRKHKYEEFLQKLLQKPSLRGSDLLYTFLTTKENFTLIADTSVPIVSDLENMYQSVAHKLRKEKGQHLDAFMNTFLVSIEADKSRLSTFESLDMGEEADSGILLDGNPQLKTRNLKHSIFEDNFGISLPEPAAYTPMMFSPCDIIQCTAYLLSHIFHVPSGVLRVFKAICSFAHQALECICRLYVERALKSLLRQHTLAHLIQLLQDVLFCQKLIPPTKLELEHRKLSAFNNIVKVNRGFVCYWLGLDVNKGLSMLLQLLQQPQLNKQLAYSLLDIVIVELYPDCNLMENSKIY